MSILLKEIERIEAMAENKRDCVKLANFWKMYALEMRDEYKSEIESLRAQLAKPQPTSQDAERFYNLGFKASGEGHNGEHGANVTGEYYLTNRKKAIDAAMKECK